MICAPSAARCGGQTGHPHGVWWSLRASGVVPGPLRAERPKGVGSREAAVEVEVSGGWRAVARRPAHVGQAELSTQMLSGDPRGGQIESPWSFWAAGAQGDVQASFASPERPSIVDRYSHRSRVVT